MEELIFCCCKNRSLGLEKRISWFAHMVLWVGVLSSIAGTLIIIGFGSDQFARLAGFVLCLPGNLIWFWHTWRLKSMQLFILSFSLLLITAVGISKNYSAIAEEEEYTSRNSIYLIVFSVQQITSHLLPISFDNSLHTNGGHHEFSKLSSCM